MTGDILNRATLYGSEDEPFEHALALDEYVKSFNQNLPGTRETIVTIPEIPLSKIIKDVEAHKLAIGADDALIKTKVYATVIKGSEYEESIYRRCCRVVNMETEKWGVPLITADDFKFLTWSRGTKPRGSGGSFWDVELDCSKEQGLYAVDASMNARWVRAQDYAAMEAALWCIGQQAGRLVMQAIVSGYLTDVASAMTQALSGWDSGSDHYKALGAMEAELAAQGMYPDVVMCNPDEGWDLGKLAQLQRYDYERVFTGVPDQHAVGALYGRIPVIRHEDVTAASIIMAASQKALVIGFYDDLTIEDYVDIREGMRGSIAYIHFDEKNGGDAMGPAGATMPTEKAWAVCTSA